MECIKIRKTILGDSLELSGLSRFQGQEVEIVISLAKTKSGQPEQKPGFMRFAGIAANETVFLEEMENEITTNRGLDLQRKFDL
ncbi:MAG: hypothetical protein HC769_02950 [Cyanobacteria bacterium CRU_2_1]|nr:hypothetical protein [Cyanobacteria bacterium RU_5_0]NJR57894.1 hypothetical protein [Cyanobacteria bacterium CRU_2_1]